MSMYTIKFIDESALVRMHNARFKGSYSRIVADWEILKPFFNEHHIVPTWKYIPYSLDMGKDTFHYKDIDFSFDDTSDLTIASFSCNSLKSKMVHCSPFIEWTPMYWWTRYPQEAGIKSALQRMDPFFLLLIFVTLALTVLCLKLFTYVGAQIGFGVILQEIPLFPFP